MRAIWNRAKYFLIGFLWDALVTLDIILTGDGSYIGVALTTMTLTILSFTVYSKLAGAEGLKVESLVYLSLGSALGAALSVYLLQ